MKADALGVPPVMVDTMTDNRVRTVAEVRHAFSKYGGKIRDRRFGVVSVQALRAAGFCARHE